MQNPPTPCIISKGTKRNNKEWVSLTKVRKKPKKNITKNINKKSFSIKQDFGLTININHQKIMLMNELVKTELFSLLSESSQENTNEEMQSAKVILYSFEIQKYTQGIERKHQALRVLQEISTPALRSG